MEAKEREKSLIILLRKLLVILQISEMEVGLAVGGAFLSSALNVLFDRLAPQGELMKMFQTDNPDYFVLLEKLRRTLRGLKIVVNKQASTSDLSEWLDELRDAVDGAENLIEEVNYEALRLKVEGQHQNLAETSNPQISGEFFLKIKKKLESTIQRLEDFEKQIGRLDLTKYLDLGEQEKREFSTSVVVESEILGRQNEIEDLVGRLLSVDANGKNLAVIPIIGMAGVGKTTLAKAIYNDERVKSHFNLKAWIFVSEPYDAFRITKELLQEIGLEVDNNLTLNQLQVKLKESLKGKKFLFVLDDVWNESSTQWDDLKNLFVLGDVGSKIIVTTRKRGVASMMCGGEINVRTLSSEVSWSLFERHAFQNMDPEEHPELKEVGKQIAAKCNGLPLALKTLAGMLRSKSEVKRWERILKSQIWELPNNGILAALKLSYNDLPPHLKRCFSYCAIFPKDYPFCKQQVIRLWIANGLIKRLPEYVQIQDLGNEYFDELQSRSLFEMVPNSSQGNTEKFLMHDLVNDLAQIASSKLCIRLEESQGSHVLEKSRHLSYLMGSGDFEKSKPLYKLEQLRTLLPISFSGYTFPLSKRVLHNILPRLTSLRALSLSHYKILKLPDSLFIKLKLLRFLDLSRTYIHKLPDSTCVLYNLETLLLSNCFYLEELPLQMEKLINLHHIDISGTSRLKMPLHLSKLKSLHVLVGATFLLGDCNGSRIGDLGELHNLYGSLSILELQKVVDRREAWKAKMGEKEHVEKLSLEWSESTANNSQTERDIILDELQPSPNIKKLQITGYRGTKFPNWLADHSFLKLVKLSLRNCKVCDSLPSLGQLPSLKFLAIGEMDRITEVTEEFYGSSSSQNPFNSLEKLEFAEMPEWKQWHVLGNGEFPALQELSIKDCPKLIGKLPENLCSLTILGISKCPAISLETPIQLSNLKKFRVAGSPKAGVLFDDAELFTSQLQGMKQIVELEIDDCQSLTSFPNLERLDLHGSDSIDELVPRARYLSVENCHNLTRLLIPSGTQTLEIRFCRNIERLTVTCGTQMTSLHIRECQKLKWLPERMQELLPSLKELDLWNCPEIESFPEGGLPFNLEVLWIWDCKKLVNNRKEWHLQRLPCLRELVTEHDDSDEEILVDENWELPCSIRRLTIGNLKTLSSQVLKSLTSLQYLSIDNLPQIQSLLEEGLPSSLSEIILHGHHELHSLPMEGLLRLTSLQCLEIRECPNLQSIPESALPSSLSRLTIVNCLNLQSILESALPSSLSKLTIRDCPNLQSIPESALPSSLSELTIWSCRNLQSIPESELPSSLSGLTIFDCPNLQSLPVKGMPSSLSYLSISSCPLLEPLLEFKRGEYWQNIAQIPYIDIDMEYQ